MASSSNHTGLGKEIADKPARITSGPQEEEHTRCTSAETLLAAAISEHTGTNRNPMLP